MEAGGWADDRREAIHRMHSNNININSGRLVLASVSRLS